MESLLKIEGLVGGYGELQVLWNVALEVFAGENVIILGPNGAGKTTLLKSVVGLLPAQGGTIHFEGTRIDRLRTDKKIRRGISFMTEMGVFTNLSVEENLLLGAYHQSPEVAHERTEEFLALFPDLTLHRHDHAGSLSGGQRKMLGVAKALMARPRLVIMDEPSSGLSPLFVSEVIGMLSRFRTDGTSFLIAEQNIKFLEIADRVYIIDGGKIRFSGSVHELESNKTIRESYFGLRGR